MTIIDLADKVYDEICGTPTDITHHVLQKVEDGEIDASFFRENEIAIFDAIDNLMFCCGICGSSDMSYKDSNMGETICVDCEREDDES